MVVNWPTMVGTGDTKEQALGDLRRSFENRKSSGQKLPRPGSHVQVEFSASHRIELYPQLKEDFIRRVLELPWAFLSDESTLFDFHEDETNDVLLERIRTVYGVDVSDIRSGNLAEIFQRIAEARTT